MYDSKINYTAVIRNAIENNKWKLFFRTTVRMCNLKIETEPSLNFKFNSALYHNITIN